MTSRRRGRMAVIIRPVVFLASSKKDTAIKAPRCDAYALERALQLNGCLLSVCRLHFCVRSSHAYLCRVLKQVAARDVDLITCAERRKQLIVLCMLWLPL